MKKILITGGAGFIGNHLCEKLLEKGFEVTVYDNLSLGKIRNIERLINHKNFTFIKGDILNRKKFGDIFKKNKFDTIFHLAANSDIGSSFKNPKTDFKNTFLTTIEVLDQAKNNDIKEIFFTSTGAIYGDTNLAVTEKMGPFSPISHYGAAKLASEGFLTAYSHNYGIKIWITRFPNVVGEYATHGAIFDFIKQLKKEPKELKVLGNGKQMKPYIYVKEIVDAILFIWKKADEDVNIYNIGVDSQTKVSDIAKMVISTMSLSSKINYTGGSRGWIGDVSKFKYDFSKLKKIGWKPKLSSDEAVKKAIEKILDEQKN